MAKKIGQMTTQEMQQEMSIAGSAEKVIKAMNEMHQVYCKHVDLTNGAELLNFDFAIKKLQAENRLMIRHLEKRINQKIL